jgi:hypothetical protein
MLYDKGSKIDVKSGILHFYIGWGGGESGQLMLANFVNFTTPTYTIQLTAGE